MKELPIACTLTPAAMADRVEWLGRLGMVSGERHGERLELRFDRSAEGNVAAWVHAEQECCAFLSFDMRHAGADLALTVSGPAGAEPVLDGLLAALSS